MFPRFPFSVAPPVSITKGFQARAIDNHINRTFAMDYVQSNFKLGRPFCKRRIIGNRNFDLHQLRQRATQTFRLTIGKSKQFTQDEQAFDGPRDPRRRGL